MTTKDGPITLDTLASWLDEEYRRMAAVPYDGETDGQHRHEGAMGMCAEIAAIIRSGVLPRHCPCRETWLFKQRKEAREADDLLGRETRDVEVPVK